MIYKELKKRDLVYNKKELYELIWLRQIKVNDKIIKTENDINNDNIKKISIGLKVLHID